jgi:NADPH2:quinone reductase
MKLIRVHEYGGPDIMRLEDAPMPEPGPGQVRVKVEAIGLNFIDIYQRSGLLKPPLPFTPGQEAAGTVDTLGQGVSEFAMGDRVVYSSVVGAYAEYVIVPADRLVPIPDEVDTRTAAAVLLQGMTAHYLTHDTFPLERTHTALIHAAAGGTGQLLVQVAKIRGARVIGTVSNQEKASTAMRAGADEVIIYTEQDFEAEAKRLTEGRGVDVVYDSVGKTTFDKSLNCLRPRGYMVLFGQSSGPVAPLDPQTLNAKGSLFLTRPTLVHYIATRDELLRRASDLFRWVTQGELHASIDHVYPLAEAAEAHRALDGRLTQGKLLLVP